MSQITEGDRPAAFGEKIYIIFGRNAVEKCYTAHLVFLTVLFLATMASCTVGNPSIQAPIASDISGTFDLSPDANGGNRSDDRNERPDRKLRYIETDIGAFHLLENDGDTQYAWRFEGDNCVLYAMGHNGSSKRQLAVFPASDYYQNYIVDFGLCGDWILVSVGHYEGSGSYFYGDFVRLKQDGSQLEHFWLTDDDRFVIVEDWVYYHFWTMGDHPKNPYGCYRIRPDGTDQEYMGDTIHRIYFYSEAEGYVYGEYATEDTVHGWNPVIDLIRCKPDGSNVSTLMKGGDLPEFDHSDFISYSDIEAYGDTVTFTVGVHGYSAGDSWRGHSLYTARYSVHKDGGGLTLLREEYESFAARAKIGTLLKIPIS